MRLHTTIIVYWIYLKVSFKAHAHKHGISLMLWGGMMTLTPKP